MADVKRKDLIEWCRIPADRLADHPGRKLPLTIVPDPAAMGVAMAETLLAEIVANNAARRPTRAILPCGPMVWYAPWRRLVNERQVSLTSLTVFHMDECLDWQGRPLPPNHPYNFRTTMEREFYSGIPAALNVPEAQRHWLTPESMPAVARALSQAPVDLTMGGWGQDGHVAYNQARRHPYSTITLEELANATTRIQENNLDTVMAIAQRSFGGAWELVPPMSITMGVKECLSARKVRVFSDTGAWKQTALRVALFGPVTTEYPMTLLQRHPDALLTATAETARHPVSEHPEWELL